MPKKLFNKDSVWIVPCLILLTLTIFMSYAVIPTLEFFKNESEKEEKKDKEKKEDKEDKEDKDKKEEEPKKEVKEKFTTFSNTAEILRPGWRNKPLPKTLEKYDGPIQGYNCGQYTGFMFGSAQTAPVEKCPSKYIIPTSNPNDYIFPGKPPAGSVATTQPPAAPKASCLSKCPKYVSEQRILGYEDDVNRKIVEYESMNILPEYKPEDVAHLERPQYMHHRKYGVDDPIISDWNRFEVGQINTRTRKTPQFSVE